MAPTAPTARKRFQAEKVTLFVTFGRMARLESDAPYAIGVILMIVSLTLSSLIIICLIVLIIGLVVGVSLARPG